MPDINNQMISQGLAHQLSGLSEAAADYKANPKANKAALEAAAAKTLAAIAAESGNLNVSSGQFAQTIKDLIKSESWARLPPPKQMEQRTEQLMAVNEAIKDVQKTIIVDISSVMGVLLEMQRKAGGLKSDERIQERKATITSAKAEFAKRELAAEQQKIGDMLSAGMQCVTGVMSVGSSAFSAGKIMGANVKTGQAWSKTNDLKSSQVNLIETKKLSSHLEMTKPGAKKIIADTDAKLARGEKLGDHEQTAAETAKLKLSDAGAADRRMMALEDDIKLKRADIDKLNSEAYETTQMARTWQDLSQGVTGVLRSQAEFGAAQLKFMSSISQVEADKEALAKSLATSGEQAALDAYQQLRDSIKSAQQMVQAIEQSMSSSLSSMARSI